MCFVSYLPLPQGYALSSNRDESPARNATHIKKETCHGRLLCYPEDTKGGSWIFASHRGEVLCLLNGAFKAHQRRLPYRQSRGVIVKSFFDYEDPVDFLQHVDLMNIEPFTLIILSPKYFIELRWDGAIKHVKRHDKSKPMCWSSSTLYTPSITDQRARLFFSHLDNSQGDYRPSLAESFHLSDNIPTLGKANSIKMNRNNVVRTISFTQIVMYAANNDCHVKMAHHNLLTDKLMSVTLD